MSGAYIRPAYIAEWVIGKPHPRAPGPVPLPKPFIGPPAPRDLVAVFHWPPQSKGASPCPSRT